MMAYSFIGSQTFTEGVSDQFRAFVALREKGKSEEEIAAAFFVSVNVVRQRLRLALGIALQLQRALADRADEQVDEAVVECSHGSVRRVKALQGTDSGA